MSARGTLAVSASAVDPSLVACFDCGTHQEVPAAEPDTIVPCVAAYAAKEARKVQLSLNL